MPEERLRAEIRGVLMEHAGQPVDRVAIFILLNTVPGGHYEERYSEADIGEALGAMLNDGEIEEHASEAGSPPSFQLGGSNRTRLPLL